MFACPKSWFRRAFNGLGTWIVQNARLSQLFRPSVDLFDRLGTEIRQIAILLLTRDVSQQCLYTSIALN